MIANNTTTDRALADCKAIQEHSATRLRARLHHATICLLQAIGERTSECDAINDWDQTSQTFLDAIEATHHLVDLCTAVSLLAAEHPRALATEIAGLRRAVAASRDSLRKEHKELLREAMDESEELRERAEDERQDYLAELASDD